jgi:hypothetical protein
MFNTQLSSPQSCTTASTDTHKDLSTKHNTPMLPQAPRNDIPSHIPKVPTSCKTLFKRVYITFLLCIVLCLSIALPLSASRLSLPQQASSREKFLFVTLWLFACTPAVFLLGCIVGGVYYYRSWRASILAKKLDEEKRERDRIRERFSAQLLRTGGGDDVDEDLRELQRPEKAASRFAGVREGLRKLHQQLGTRSGKTRVDELVLWDAENIELTDITTEALEGRELERESGRNSEESSMRWEQVGFEDIDLGIAGRVKVREMV